MATIGFCNVCLITGVKMEMLEATDIYRFIDTNGLPLLVCYECATLVGKVNMLLNKYHIAQSILQNMIQTRNQITEEELKSIDRKSLMLESNLEYCTQPLIISFDTEPDRDLTVQSNHHHQSKKGEDEQEEKFSIIEDFEDYHQSKKDDDQEERCSITVEFEEETFIDNLINECDDTDQKKISDSADSNDLLQMLDNCGDKDALLEGVDLIVNKLSDDVDKIMKKKRKIKVPKSTKKESQPKIDLLESLFEITELTRSEQIKEFSKRKESVKFLNSKYKCDLCFRGFNQRNTYETHLKVCHDPNQRSTSCPVCNIIQKNDWRLKQHITSRHRRIYKCKKCDFISSSRVTVWRHKNWHDGETYNCRFCGESFDKKMTQLSHERLKHPSEFLCDLCGLPFVSAYGIQAHKRLAHFDHKESTEEADPHLYCEECKIQFASSVAWKTHLQKSIKHNPHIGTSTPKPLPVCSYCGLECMDRKELKYHQSAKRCKQLEAVRPPKGRKANRPVPRQEQQEQQYPTQCNYCDAVVTDKRQHFFHHKSLHFFKPYKKGDFVCETCGKTFLTQGALTLHVQAKHNELERRFECDYCHAKFKTKVHLKAHIQRHLHPVNLCSDCGKVFKSKCTLKVHIRNAHGGPRPHECRFCQKTFVQGSLLKVHVNEVHLGLAKKRIRTKKKTNS